MVRKPSAVNGIDINWTIVITGELAVCSAFWMI